MRFILSRFPQKKSSNWYFFPTNICLRVNKRRMKSTLWSLTDNNICQSHCRAQRILSAFSIPLFFSHQSHNFTSIPRNVVLHAQKFHAHLFSCPHRAWGQVARVPSRPSWSPGMARAEEPPMEKFGAYSAYNGPPPSSRWDNYTGDWSWKRRGQVRSLSVCSLSRWHWSFLSFFLSDH